MNIGIFTEKKNQPSEADIQQALGPYQEAWQALVNHIQNCYALETDLKFLYGKGYGWARRFYAKSKVLTSLFPAQNGFVAQVNLSEAGCAQAEAQAAGQAVAQAITRANLYPEGRWLFVRVETAEDLEDIRTLLAIRAAEKRIPSR